MEGLVIGGEISSKAFESVQPMKESKMQPANNLGFIDSLNGAILNVNKLQLDSDIKMQELATGKTQNIHEPMILAEKADISLKLMVQVRNKVIEAYQEFMRMQV